MLFLRLEETLIGAAAGMFVAAFILPNPTRDQVRRSGQAVLAQLAVVIRLGAEALAGGAAVPTGAMRQVDRLLADLDVALAPLRAGRALWRRASMERPVSALLECVHWARLLTAQVQAGPPDPSASAGLSRIARRLEQLGQGTPADLATPLDTSGDAIGRTINHLDRAVTTLSERMALGVYETYGVDP